MLALVGHQFLTMLEPPEVAPCGYGSRDSKLWVQTFGYTNKIPVSPYRKVRRWSRADTTLLTLLTPVLCRDGNLVSGTALQHLLLTDLLEHPLMKICILQPSSCKSWFLGTDTSLLSPLQFLPGLSEPIPHIFLIY